jgi:translation initiation factor IF-2
VSYAFGTVGTYVRARHGRSPLSEESGGIVRTPLRTGRRRGPSGGRLRRGRTPGRSRQGAGRPAGGGDQCLAPQRSSQRRQLAGGQDGLVGGRGRRGPGDGPAPRRSPRYLGCPSGGSAVGGPGPGDRLGRSRPTGGRGRPVGSSRHRGSGWAARTVSPGPGRRLGGARGGPPSGHPPVSTPAPLDRRRRRLPHGPPHDRRRRGDDPGRPDAPPREGVRRGTSGGASGTGRGQRGRRPGRHGPGVTNGGRPPGRRPGHGARAGRSLRPGAGPRGGRGDL